MAVEPKNHNADAVQSINVQFEQAYFRPEFRMGLDSLSSRIRSAWAMLVIHGIQVVKQHRIGEVLALLIPSKWHAGGTSSSEHSSERSALLPQAGLASISFGVFMHHSVVK